MAQCLRVEPAHAEAIRKGRFAPITEFFVEPRIHRLFLPKDFFEGVAAGDEFFERVFALGNHPARAVEGDAVGIVCLGKQPVGKVLDFCQLQLDFVVQTGDLFLHLFFSHFYVSPCYLRFCFALYIY